MIQVRSRSPDKTYSLLHALLQPTFRNCGLSNMQEGKQQEPSEATAAVAGIFLSFVLYYYPF